MQQLVYFLQKYRYFLYFLLLECIAIALIFNNHDFHRSKFVNSANFVTGGLYKKASNISDYFHLKEINKALVEENLQLKNQLQQLQFPIDSTLIVSIIDSTKFHQNYAYINTKIISNNYHETFNFLTINNGKKDGITTEMAIINSKGIIGVVDDVSNRYARVRSILNKNSKINARLKNSFHFGTLTWDGKNYNTVQLTDIPRQAILRIGDTIITGGKSTIFPEGIPIGIIKKIPEKLSSAGNTIDIQLFNDMSNLSHGYAIISYHKNEVKKLENAAIK